MDKRSLNREVDLVRRRRLNCKSASFACIHPKRAFIRLEYILTQRNSDEGTELGKVAAAHRLGPKANTGAINAGLRALDRTGAPCRKWEKQPLRLRSFTGVLWQLPSWRTHALAKSHDVDGEGKEVSVSASALEESGGDGDSDTKPSHSLLPPGTGTDTVNGSSAVPSEKSNSGDGDVTPAPSNLVERSSPAIAMAA